MDAISIIVPVNVDASAGLIFMAGRYAERFTKMEARLTELENQKPEMTTALLKEQLKYLSHTLEGIQSQVNLLARSLAMRENRVEANDDRA